MKYAPGIALKEAIIYTTKIALIHQNSLIIIVNGPKQCMFSRSLYDGLAR